jgi:hypothetical protein
MTRAAASDLWTARRQKHEHLQERHHIANTTYKGRSLSLVLLIGNSSEHFGIAGLRRRSAVERLLGSWVRIPWEACMSVSCTVFVLSGRGLCDGPIPRPEESYRLWCVFECYQVKIKTLYTYCEKFGRRGKDYERKRFRNIVKTQHVGL